VINPKRLLYLIPAILAVSCSSSPEGELKDFFKSLYPIYKNLSTKPDQILNDDYRENLPDPAPASKLPDDIKKANGELDLLRLYADSDKVLEVKWRQLAEINASRKKHGLKTLNLSIPACRIANMHCLDMVNSGYFSHYSLDGKKPYHRWGLNGGLDHVAENLHSRVQNIPLANSLDDIFFYMRIGHKRFMEELPPNDGHRKEILNPYHTDVGIGYALRGSNFRYSELYVDKYLEIEPPPSSMKPGLVTIRGRVLEPDKYGVLLAVVYFDPMRKTYNKLVRSSSYPDFSDIKLDQKAPWSLKYDIKTGNFSIPINLHKSRTGYAYIQIFVRANPRSIPYKPRGTVAISNNGAICASGIVIKIR